MPRKILIVDDNELNRLLLKNTLSQDYDALEATNGKEALTLLHKHYKMLSAVLLDIVMPEMDGYEVLRQIRDNVLFSQLPVIMVTGSEDEDSRVKALLLGANDFILKPFNPEIVKHCLKNNIALRETASILNAIQKDKLTGLYNREAFFEKVSGMIADHEPGYYILSCFDIDNFKLINDQYGAAEGDRLLREIGKAVGKNAEEIGGIAGRISADNFSALFPANNEMTVVLQQILDKELVSLEQQSVSFSIGRYVVTDLSIPASAIYDRAFIAKQSVKGRYDEHLAYFDHAMLEKLIRDQQITGEMETALQEHQFESWFQPQYNHATGALLGAEALARWRHPQKGIIPPGEFIPLFEQNGFIYELDKYIWRDVCGYLRKWLDQGYTPLPVSVNISRYDIFRSNLIEVLTGLVKEFGIPVDLLRLEITESAFTASSSMIVKIVKQLIALGFTVEIDDFGSGYSSLNTLKNVPAQVVKLDMRFLDGEDDGKRGGNILESIVRMTKWLGMTVLAEGVEEQKQADFLKSIGCTYVQGYLYARPMPATDFEALLRQVEIEQHPFISGEDEAVFTDAFWDPKSLDSVVFNKYSGGACVYEFHQGQIEMVRATDKYIHTVFGPQMTAADAMNLDWSQHIDEQTSAALTEAVFKSARTQQEVTGNYRFVNLPGCPPETYLCSQLRVIAATDDRYLVYCTSINITAQLVAEQKSAAIADQLTAVMDHVSCGITAVIYHEQDVEYLLINNRYYEILGYTKEQYEKLAAFAPIHQDDQQRVIAAAMQAYTTEQAMTIEFRAIKQDGSQIWLRDAMTITHIAGIEQPVQLSMFSDITAERQAEQELLDNLPGGAILYEYDGQNFRIAHINKRYWDLVDRAPIDYSSLSAATAIHPDDLAFARAEITAAIKENRDIDCNLRIRYGTKGYRLFRVTGRIVPKTAGLYAINAIYTPLAPETSSLQDMLPVALQAVMDFSSELAFVKDRKLRYISCSRNFARLAGKNSERELVGKTSFELFPPELATQYDAADQDILTNGKSLVDIDNQFPTENGVRHLRFSKYPLLDLDGNILGIYSSGHDITEARETKSRLDLLTNNIPGGIAVYEGIPDALDQIKLTYFSDGFCRLFGYSRAEYEQLAAVNPLGLVVSADVSPIYEKVLSLVHNDIPMDYTYRARVKDGSTKWINVKAVMGEPNGNKLTVNALFFDVTEQKNALENLRVSEETNRLAIKQSKNMVCQYNVAARKLLIAPGMNPIFEAPDIETNVPFQAITEGKISPATADTYSAFYEQIHQGKKNGSALFQRKSTIGWRWIEGHFSTIFSDDGQPLTAVLSFTDVTENIEKDAAYKKWQQSFRNRPPESYSLYHCNVSKNTILNSSEGLLLSENLKLNTPYWDVRTNHYVEQGIYSEDQERFRAIMDRETQLTRYSQGKRTDTLEYRENLPEGGVRWLRLTLDLIDSPYSADVEAYLMFEDIDEAKRAELEIIERAETDPLTGVLNRATFAVKVNKLIRDSRPDTQHALLMLDIDGFKLVNDVFGHGSGDQILLDLAELLRHSLRRDDLVGRLGGDEFVIFLSEIPDEAAVAKKAQQICELTQKTLSAEVQISGSIGIACYPQDGNCFETLYKKADKTLYHVKGNGKNNYAFYNQKLTAEPIPQTNRPHSLSPVLGEKKRRMLIVDDNKIDLAMLANLFKDQFKIEKAADGNAALIKLHHYGSAISIVLLDLMMPGMDGFTVLEKMQQSVNMKSIPVVVASGVEGHDTMLQAIRAGATDFVAKPVDPDILRIRVQSAISKAENEHLRAQNSFLELQSDEMNSYKTALEKTGTLVAMHDWSKSAFTYSPSMGTHLAGTYDQRSLWRILLSDLVADPQTVQKMQQLVHDIANNRKRMDGAMTVQLKTANGQKRPYLMNVYKQTNDYGLTDKLILTFTETEAESSQ